MTNKKLTQKCSNCAEFRDHGNMKPTGDCVVYFREVAKGYGFECRRYKPKDA